MLGFEGMLNVGKVFMSYCIVFMVGYLPAISFFKINFEALCNLENSGKLSGYSAVSEMAQLTAVTAALMNEV